MTELEQAARDEHGRVAEQLAKLRAERDRINDAIRPLVDEEQQLRRVVAVFDRANGKQPARPAVKRVKEAPKP